MDQGELAQHRATLCRFLLFLLGSLDDAEEIAQETFRVALSKGPDPAKGANYGAWLRSIARNLARNHVRKHRRSPILLQGSLDEIAEARFVETGADRNDLWEARRQALASCMAKLSAADRTLLRRRYELRQKVREMARALGLEPNSLSKRLERIRNGLRDCIRARLNGDGRE